MSPAGKVETFATLTEKQVTALALGPDGAVYAAGSPGGKVYRLDGGGKASLYYETKAQYVWSLAFSGPVLFVATGLPGEIHRVEAAGRGKRVHASSDAHVRTLHAAANGEVWAGTSGTGLVLRIDSSGKATTVYDSGKTEVTAIASGPDGRVWAAVSSSEGASSGEPVSAPLPQPPRAPRPSAPAGEGDDKEKKPEVSVTVGAPRLAPSRPAGRSGYSSEIVLFEKGEPPRIVWSSSDEMVFDLGDAEAGSVLAGTGPKGRLYRISRDTWSLDRTFDEKQVSVIAGESIATNAASAFYRMREGERTGDTDRGEAVVARRFRLDHIDRTQVVILCHKLWIGIPRLAVTDGCRHLRTDGMHVAFEPHERRNRDDREKHDKRNQHPFHARLNGSGSRNHLPRSSRSAIHPGSWPLPGGSSSGSSG